MTERIEDVYKHCFSHVCASGAIGYMTLQEVLNTYTESMNKDLADCGVVAEAGEVKKYLTEQYNLLKEVKTKDTDVPRL